MGPLTHTKEEREEDVEREGDIYQNIYVSFGFFAQPLQRRGEVSLYRQWKMLSFQGKPTKGSRLPKDAKAKGPRLP